MKWFMFALVFMVLSLSASAPISGQPVITVKFGLNETHITTRDYPYKSMRMGASIAIPTHNRHGLQFGIDYVRKGEIGLEIAYIEFSGLGTVLVISSSHGLSLSILAGPAVAIKIGDDDIIRLKAVDLGIVGGVGMQMPIFKTTTLKTEVLYTRGIRSISENPHLKNRVLSFSVGFGFSI